MRWVFFDCMETLIQMNIDSMDVYADWAFEGAAELGIWDSDAFRSAWKRERERITRDASLREGTVRERIRAMFDGLGDDARFRGDLEGAVERIHEAFWTRYRSASFVLPEVPEAIDALRRRAPEIGLGVASNFMVHGGIEHLLEFHGLATRFDRVVVSCDVGWRKPSRRLYDAVLDAAGCAPGEVLFVGDNPGADFHGPREAGMRSILYDRNDRHPKLAPRLTSFRELLPELDEQRDGRDG